MFPKPVIDKDNEPYWLAASAGKLVFQKCRHCQQFWYPPGPVCPRCREAEYEWEAVSGKGVVSCAVKYHKKYYETVDVPYVVAQIELPEGVRLLANVTGCDGRSLEETPPKAGTAVEVVYLDTGEKLGEDGAARTLKVPAVRVLG